MKFIKIFLLAVTLAFSSISFAITTLDERISTARENFESVLQDTPDKDVSVTAFFTNDMSLEDVRASLSNSPLSVKGFRHGTQSYSGGYTLNPGETIDVAIVNYRNDHSFFLQKRMELEDSMLRTETDDGLRKAIVIHRKEADQMKTDFEKNGIRVIGVEFYGRVKDIQDFKEKNSFVRVLELKEKGKPQSAILPQH